LLFAACGDDSDAGPTAAVDFSTAAQSLVAEIPLAEDDLSGGWRPAADDEEDLTGNVELPEGCNIFDLNVAFPDAVARASGPRLRGSLGEQVTSYGAVYRGADLAQEAVDNTRDILTRCGNDYKVAVEKIADEELSALGINLGFLADLDVTLQELPIATGDGAAFYRLQAKVNVPGDDLTFTLDARVVRAGRVVSAVTYYRQGDTDTQAAQEVTAALVASAGEVDGELPD
jgi:hypothetical protein